MLRKEDMATVPPILLSIITCERVVRDKFSGMGFINGIVHTISAPNYPARHARIVLFAELTNGHGQINCSINLVDINEDDKIIWKVEKMPVKFNDVRQIQNIVFDLQGIVFPHEGEYRFQLFAEEHLLGERRIVCRKIELPKGGK